MARLTIYKDNYISSTTVSNRFIDEYMANANDAQLKVYFYLLRMLGANLSVGISDIADKFNHTEKDILRALRYWEKQGLLVLDFDADKNLIGIHMRSLSAAPVCPAEASLPLQAEAAEAAAAPAYTAPAQAPAAVPAPEAHAIPVSAEETPVPAFIKPAYSADKLREFKARENTAQLLFIAESYIGRPLTPAELKTILFFTDVLHFSDDLIDYLIQYCVDRGKKDFKYIEKVAIDWAESGITTPEQAAARGSKYDKSVYTIMNELGRTGSPTHKELEYILRWTKEYGFSTDIILEACERTVLATDKYRFEYAEGILSSWKQANVHHTADIQRIDDIHQQKKKTAARQVSSSNRFNQFSQNNYDFNSLEKELLSN